MAKENDYIYVGDIGSGGLNSRDDSRNIKNNELSYILNMDIKSQGSLMTRFGYELWGEIAGASGGFRMALPYYKTYGTNSGDHLVLAHSNGNAYVSTNAAPTPSSLGAWGTDDGEPVRGVVFDNMAIFGSGLAANTVQKYDASALANLGGTPPDGHIFGVINKTLCMVTRAAPGITYLSDINDPENWSSGIASNTSVGGLDDGQKVTGMLESNDAPLFFKERSKHIADLIFDSSDVLLRISFKEKRDNSGGSIAPSSIQSMLNNFGEVVYYLSERGFQGYGTLENFDGQRNPADISEKIRPTVDGINFAYARFAHSVSTGDSYECLVPYNSSTSNNINFVFNREFGAWTLYDDYPFASIVNFRGTDGRTQILLASAVEPKIFKRNNYFDDNSFGYRREFHTKTFTYGTRRRWDYIDFEGVKTIGSTIFVDVVIDGVAQKFKVTDESLMQGLGGGYIGASSIGSSYLGGGYYGSGVPLYRWRGRAKIDNGEGYELQIKMYNENAGEGWGASSYGIMSSQVNNEIPANMRGNEPYLIKIN